MKKIIKVTFLAVACIPISVIFSLGFNFMNECPLWAGHAFGGIVGLMVYFNSLDKI